MSAKPRATPGRRGRLILRRVFDAARTAAPSRVSQSRAKAHVVRAARWFVDAALRDEELAVAPANGAGVPRDGKSVGPQKPRQMPGVLLEPRYQAAPVSDKIPRPRTLSPLAEALAACPPLTTMPPLVIQWPTIGPI